MHIQDNNSLPNFLIVDDDATFCRVLAIALNKRGFDTMMAHTVDEAWQIAQQNPPEYAVVDLKMPGPSGLTLISKLKMLDEKTQIVILTGYASIPTAIEAIKLGAKHYLAKPVDADEILSAFEHNFSNAEVPVSSKPLSMDRLEWEHIQKVLLQSQGNISATARALGMHRRTLQRKLTKYPVRS